MTPAPISPLGWRLLTVGMVRTMENTWTVSLTFELLTAWIKDRKIT